MVKKQLSEHEKDFFLAYKAHMYTVQKDFKQLKHKADEEETKTRRDQKIHPSRRSSTGSWPRRCGWTSSARSTSASWTGGRARPRPWTRTATSSRRRSRPRRSTTCPCAAPWRKRRPRRTRPSCTA